MRNGGDKLCILTNDTGLMNRQWIALGVALLVVLAGCNALTGGQPQKTTTETTRATTTVTQSTPTTATTTQQPPNPWNADSLAVYVDSELADRNYTTLAAEAIAFWNENASERAVNDYRVNPTLRLTDSRDDADVVIQYQPILECEGVTSDIGDVRAYCSDYFQAGDTPADTTEIVVTSRYENQTTIRLTVNALGGLYGRTSTSPPLDIEESPNLTDPFITADTVVVAIDNEATPSRNFTPMVREALDYWMANDDEYGTYTTDFSLQPDAEDPDMVIHVRENVSYCGLHDRENVLGCADILNKQQGKEIPVRVVLKAGYTDASSVMVLKHELGHVYGLEHGSTPSEWMEATYDADRLPTKDARDQVNPWSPNPVTIAVDGSTYPDPGEIEGDIQHVIDYFNELSPEGLQLELVSDPENAHIVVREVPAHESECLDPGYASCGMPFGYSVDEDSALEEYTRMVIHTNDVPDDEVAWHVGYWIDSTVTPGESAEYWDDPGSDDRSNWW